MPRQVVIVCLCPGRGGSWVLFSSSVAVQLAFILLGLAQSSSRELSGGLCPWAHPVLLVLRTFLFWGLQCFPSRSPQSSRFWRMTRPLSVLPLPHGVVAVCSDRCDWCTLVPGIGRAESVPQPRSGGAGPSPHGCQGLRDSGGRGHQGGSGLPCVFQGLPRAPPRSTPATSRDKASSTEATERLRRARPPSSSGRTATSRQAFCMFPDSPCVSDVTRVASLVTSSNETGELAPRALPERRCSALVRFSEITRVCMLPLATHSWHFVSSAIASGASSFDFRGSPCARWRCGPLWAWGTVTRQSLGCAFRPTEPASQEGAAASGSGRRPQGAEGQGSGWHGWLRPAALPQVTVSGPGITDRDGAARVSDLRRAVPLPGRPGLAHPRTLVPAEGLSARSAGDWMCGGRQRRVG